MRDLLRRIMTRGLAWITLIHVLLLLTFWLTNALFYAEVNDYLTNLLHARSDYVSLFLVISAVVGLGNLAQLFFYRLGKRGRLFTIATWCAGIVDLIYLALFYGSFWLLFKESPVEAVRVVQLVSYFRIIPDSILLILIALGAAMWIRKRIHTNGRGANGRTVIAVLAMLVLLWALPLVFPPGSIYRGALPDKPRIIAHRGASMLAPENTLVAMERAAGLGTYGVETDLSISTDGIPFLMHDDTLKRTTNVKEVFPGRENDRSESFALADVRRLNAGVWFTKTDPYRAIATGTATPAAAELYSRQTVPTLDEELEVVRRNKLTFIFDLKPLSASSQYANRFFEIVLNQIHQAGIDRQVWFLVDRRALETLRTTAPEMLPAFGGDYARPPDANEIATEGYKVMNAEYGLPEEWIHKYQAAGLWVNLYTIDEPWQFSRLWLLGVNSTTTSNAHVMVALDAPILALPYSLYLLVWTGLGLIALALFGIIVRQNQPVPLKAP